MRFLRDTTAGIILFLIVPTISMAEERSQAPPELRLSNPYGQFYGQKVESVGLGIYLAF